MKSTTIFSDFLTELGVPHTAEYSNKRFGSMDFKTLFGLSHLLKDYGIESRGVKADDCRAAITKIAPPFIA